jgi:hypothetical protein
MITIGSPYFVWINTNEIISSWYLLDAVCVAPLLGGRARTDKEVHRVRDEGRREPQWRAVLPAHPPSEKGVRLAQKIQVGLRTPLETQREKC